MLKKNVIIIGLTSLMILSGCSAVNLEQQNSNSNAIAEAADPLEFLVTYGQGLCQLVTSFDSYKNKLNDQSFVSKFEDTEVLRVLALEAKSELELNNYQTIYNSIIANSLADSYTESIRLFKLADKNYRDYLNKTESTYGREGLAEATVNLNTFTKTLEKIDTTVSSETEELIKNNTNINANLLTTVSKPYNVCLFSIKASEAQATKNETQQLKESCSYDASKSGIDSIAETDAGVYEVTKSTSLFKSPFEDNCPLVDVIRGTTIILDSPETLGAATALEGQMQMWYRVEVNNIQGWIRKEYLSKSQNQSILDALRKQGKVFDAPPY